jgi:hypothetical protein
VMFEKKTKRECLYGSGQEHFRLNPIWVLFKRLEGYCLEQGL